MVVENRSKIAQTCCSVGPLATKSKKKNMVWPTNVLQKYSQHKGFHDFSSKSSTVGHFCMFFPLCLFSFPGYIVHIYLCCFSSLIAALFPVRFSSLACLLSASSSKSLVKRSFENSRKHCSKSLVKRSFETTAGQRRRRPWLGGRFGARMRPLDPATEPLGSRGGRERSDFLVLRDHFAKAQL